MSLTHVVLFTLADPSDAAETVERLRSMVGRVPSLLGLRAGVGDGTPGNAHVVLVTEHDDAAGLAAYAADPVHQEFLGWVRPRLAGRAAVDTTELA